MPNNIDNALSAAIRSMENTIIPAMNKGNPLANEQAAIITQLLRFMRDRIPYMQQRDWLELKIYAAMVEALTDDIASLLNEQLENTNRLMKEVSAALATPTPEPGLLGKLAEELRSTLSNLVRVANNQKEQQRRRIESVIVQGSKQLLDLQRVWLAPTGLVADADKLPDLDSQIRTKKMQYTVTTMQ